MIDRQEALKLVYSEIRPSFSYIHQWCVHEYISSWDIFHYLRWKPIAWKRWQTIYNFDDQSLDRFAVTMIFKLWLEINEPLEYQSDECVVFVARCIWKARYLSDKLKK